MLQHAESDIPRPARDIQNRLPFPLLDAILHTGVYGAHEVVFPESVRADGHEVVHGVIGGGDGGEDVGDAGLLGRRGNGLEAEVCGWAGVRSWLLGLGLGLGETEGAGEAAVWGAGVEEAARGYVDGGTVEGWGRHGGGLCLFFM